MFLSTHVRTTSVRDVRGTRRDLSAPTVGDDSLYSSTDSPHYALTPRTPSVHWYDWEGADDHKRLSDHTTSLAVPYPTPHFQESKVYERDPHPTGPLYGHTLQAYGDTRTWTEALMKSV